MAFVFKCRKTLVTLRNTTEDMQEIAVYKEGKPAWVDPISMRIVKTPSPVHSSVFFPIMHEVS